MKKTTRGRRAVIAIVAFCLVFVVIAALCTMGTWSHGQMWLEVLPARAWGFGELDQDGTDHVDVCRNLGVISICTRSPRSGPSPPFR